MDQRPRNGGPLLFASAQLMDEMIGAFPQADQLDQSGGALFAFRRGHPLQEERQGDVLEHIHCWQKVEELEDQSHLTPPEVGQCRVTGRVQGEAVDHDFALRGMIEAGEQVDERALAATTRTADRHELVPRDLN